MNKIKRFVALLLTTTLFLTACGKTAIVETGSPPTDAALEDLSDIPEEYAFGTNTLPWENPPEDWTPKVDESDPFGFQEASLSPENPTFTHEGVSLALDPLYVSDEMNLSVKPVVLPPAWEGAAMKAYDFTMESYHEDMGPIEIRIPYPSGQASVDTAIGAGYFNEATNTWEPVAFWRDDENQQVVIETNHLSIYSCFEFSGENTRYTKVSQIFAIPVLPDNLKGRHSDVILEAIDNSLTPGQKALDLGLAMTNDVLNFSGALVSLSGLAYSTEFLDGLGGAFTNVGAIMAVAQLAYDYDQGKKDALVANALKNIYNYMVSFFGNSLMGAAYVSVFAIDYSLSWFIQEALSGRQDIYAEAYKLYYSEAPNHRDAVAWYRVIRNIQREHPNIDEFKVKVEEEVNNYTKKFWTESDDLIGEYQTRAMTTGFSTLGGMNQGVQDEISNNYKNELATGMLKSVFNRLEKELMMQQQANYRKSLEDLARYLNQVVRMKVFEKPTAAPPKYAGYYVRFGPLEAEVDKDQWTGRINGEGILNASFTVLGHLEAGAPNELRLYPNRLALEEDEPELTVPFTISVPYTEVELIRDERLTKLVLKRTSGEVLSNAGLLFEDEYKSFYHENAFPFPLEHLLSQNPIIIPADNVINTSLSGSWSTDTLKGESKDASWSTSYYYTVNNFTLHVNLDTNRELPVRGTDDKALMLNGTGTYSYDVTVTTVFEGTQEITLLEKILTNATRTTTVNLTSSGTAQMFAGSTKIDDSKDIVVYEDDIENMKTTDVYLQLETLESHFSGVVENYSMKVWEDGTEQEETWSTPVEGDGGVSSQNPVSLYFKYPVQ